MDGWMEFWVSERAKELRQEAYQAHLARDHLKVARRGEFPSPYQRILGWLASTVLHRLGVRAQGRHLAAAADSWDAVGAGASSRHPRPPSSTRSPPGPLGRDTLQAHAGRMLKLYRLVPDRLLDRVILRFLGLPRAFGVRTELLDPVS